MKIPFWKFYQKNYLPVAIFMLGLAFLAYLGQEYLVAIILGLIELAIIAFAWLSYNDKIQ